MDTCVFTGQKWMVGTKVRITNPLKKSTLTQKKEQELNSAKI